MTWPIHDVSRIDDIGCAAEELDTRWSVPTNRRAPMKVHRLNDLFAIDVVTAHSRRPPRVFWSVNVRPKAVGRSSGLIGDVRIRHADRRVSGIRFRVEVAVGSPSPDSDSQ